MAPLFDMGKKKKILSDKYTHAVGVPQYLPSNKKPKLCELYDYEKYSKLLHEINNSSLSEEEKNFLRLGATRHIVFNYAKIADYYAHSSKEMQELMEHSALVIIDFEDAIMNGYVELSKQVHEIVRKTGEADEE